MFIGVWSHHGSEEQELDLSSLRRFRFVISHNGPESWRPQPNFLEVRNHVYFTITMDINKCMSKSWNELVYIYLVHEFVIINHVHVFLLRNYIRWNCCSPSLEHRWFPKKRCIFCLQKIDMWDLLCLKNHLILLFHIVYIGSWLIQKQWTALLCISYIVIGILSITSFLAECFWWVYIYFDIITIVSICNGTSATGQESISPSYIVYGNCCGPQI